MTAKGKAQGAGAAAATRKAPRGIVPIHDLPAGPGLYRLWMDLEADLATRVGSLGQVVLPAGRYVYTGSAQQGIRTRVQRHMDGSRPVRWHIDYLLPHVTIVHAEARTEPDLTECGLSGELTRWPEPVLAVRGFGASDCGCCGHLVRMPRWMPAPFCTSATLPSGQTIRVRLLRPDDSQRLGAYFVGLSDRTRSRYGPHAFDQPTADALCASLDPRDMLRIVATIGRREDEEIIAYLLVKTGVRESDGKRYAALGIALKPEESGALAPSVADAWQNRGVASAVMPVLITMARSIGIRRLVLWDGVIADNHLAQGFYRKWGFTRVGEFTTSVHNYDMIAEIGG